MLWKDRILSTVMAVVVTAAATAAVVRFSPEMPRFTPGQIEEGITYEATGVPSDTIVALVDGNGAEAELFTYWADYVCTSLENSRSVDIVSNWDKEVISGGTLKDFIREDALAALKQQLVTENLAAEYGITLSAEDEAAMAAMRERNVELLGEDGYRTRIYQLGLSEAGYERVVRMYALYGAIHEEYNKPGSALYASDDVLHAYAADYVTVDHILLPTIDLTTGISLDEGTIAEHRALAEDLLAQLRASDDPVALFGELADEYSEDTGRRRNPNGYTLGPSDPFVSAFKNTAFALEENEISDIVETEYGYHIMLRKPLDISAAAKAVREEYFTVWFSDHVQSAEIETNPVLDSFDLPALYDALRAAQRAENEG